MNRKTSINIFTMVLGICLIGINFYFKGEGFRSLAGVCLGTGAGLFGMSISNILMRRYELRNPDIAKQNAISLKDERNIIIRNRAKAKAGDITQWLIMGIAYITILIDAPLWVTLAVVSVFVVYNVLGLFYMSQFEKEM